MEGQVRFKRGPHPDYSETILILHLRESDVKPQALTASWRNALVRIW